MIFYNSQHPNRSVSKLDDYYSCGSVKANASDESTLMNASCLQDLREAIGEDIFLSELEDSVSVAMFKNCEFEHEIRGDLYEALSQAVDRLKNVVVLSEKNDINYYYKSSVLMQ